MKNGIRHEIQSRFCFYSRPGNTHVSEYMGCAAGCAHCTGSTPAEQRCPARNTCERENTSFSESSRKTTGKIRAWALPWSEPAKSTRWLPVKRRENTKSRRKCFNGKDRNCWSKMFVKQNRTWITKKKRQKISKVTSEMWTYPRGVCSSARSLGTVLSLLPHSINSSSKLAACFYGVWDAEPWLCMRLLQLHWNRLPGLQKNLQTSSASPAGFRNEPTRQQWGRCKPAPVQRGA